MRGELSSARLRTKLVWIAAFYFASGFPFGLFIELLPVYLRDRGLELATISGILGVAGIAWTAKFAWAPLADRFGTRKQWIVATQVVLGLTIGALGFIDPEGPSVVADAAGGGFWQPIADFLRQPLAAGALLFGVLLVLATTSATQDITIDAYSIEILEERELGPANGVRVAAYRAAMLTSSALLVGLAAATGWRMVFIIGGALMFGAAALSLTAPRTRNLSASHAPIWEPLVAFLRLPHLWAVILFALTFKLGDAAMLIMARTFPVDVGLTLPQISLLASLGLAFNTAGALLGGVVVARIGIFRALWGLGLVQAFSNLGYYLVARGTATVYTVGAAKLFEELSYGLGTAAFLAFLMSICEKRYAATQYALLSALFGFSRQVAIWTSGPLTERFGYADYFLITFVLAFPAFLLLPWIGRLKRRDVPVPAID